MSASRLQNLQFTPKSMLVTALSITLLACGGASAGKPSNTQPEAGKTANETKDGASASTETSDKAKEPEKLEFPTACAKESGDVCAPPATFTKHLCGAPNASSLALALFAKGSPWVRMYLARNTEAWDPSTTGGAAMKLAFDEEVLVLAYRPAKTGGIVVNGSSGTYDVLRWDGTCASLNADELRKWYPPEPGFADIPWKKLEDTMQQKLLEDGRVSLKEGEMKKACKGLSRNQTNAACDKAQKSLSKAIVAYVRVNGGLPTPSVSP